MADRSAECPQCEVHKANLEQAKETRAYLEAQIDALNKANEDLAARLKS